MRNPWDDTEHNLSAFERNRVFLNLQGKECLEISHLTGADADSDSRAVAAGDFNNDGMPDLLVRSVGGGPLRMFENQWPAKRWLKIQLRGVRSNSLGIGAKLKLEVGGRSLQRELYPESSFQSQQPSLVLLGLDEAEQAERLTIYWPSGEEQILENIPADSHLLITEGENEPRRLNAAPKP